MFGAALVQAEQVVRAAEAGDYRHMVPIEMKLDDGCLPVGRSLIPVSSMKIINRPSRRAFFERGPGVASNGAPPLHHARSRAAQAFAR
jgi:hypothetical protein